MIVGKYDEAKILSSRGSLKSINRGLLQQFGREGEFLFFDLPIKAFAARRCRRYYHVRSVSVRKHFTVLDFFNCGFELDDLD